MSYVPRTSTRTRTVKVLTPELTIASRDSIKTSPAVAATTPPASKPVTETSEPESEEIPMAAIEAGSPRPEPVLDGETSGKEDRDILGTTLEGKLSNGTPSETKDKDAVVVLAETPQSEQKLVIASASAPKPTGAVSLSPGLLKLKPASVPVKSAVVAPHAGTFIHPAPKTGVPFKRKLNFDITNGTVTKQIKTETLKVIPGIVHASSSSLAGDVKPIFSAVTPATGAGGTPVGATSSSAAAVPGVQVVKITMPGAPNTTTPILKKDFKAPAPPTGVAATPTLKRSVPRKLSGRTSATASRSSSVSGDNDDSDDDSNGMSSSRFDSSLNVITKKFFELFKNSPDGIVDLNEASSQLHVPKRRIYDITNVLEGIGLTKKKSKNRVEWINKDGSIQEEEDSSDEDRALNQALEDVEKLTLELFRKEKKHLYVRPEALKEIDYVHNKTIICVKKRADTKLIVYPSDPRRLSIGTTADYSQQMWLVPTFLWPGWEAGGETVRAAEMLMSPIKQESIELPPEIKQEPIDETALLDDTLDTTLNNSICSNSEAGMVFNDSMLTVSELSDSTCGAGHSQTDSDYSQIDYSLSPQKYWPLPASPNSVNPPPELLAMEPFEGFDFMFGLDLSEEGFGEMLQLNL
ncbi:transcription factor E2F1-like isoform X2 [Paramacrobiotus metropolitanus]|uniref:transcription factor E2F1-like isoform X2 n=1 Tax=Paramacrobiotus metropolitanus TaxID=2943436 RepID=UPI002446512A|nr:transcription factor E2F1-like isoform X2 [Paramacrobiotus metropolitanus]